MVKKQCPGRLPWENTLCCLRERQGPSQKNIWQDWERVVGLIGQGHIWDVLNLGAQPDSSLLPVGRNRETLPPLSQPDGPEQWLLSRLAPWVESLGATEPRGPLCGHGQGQGARGGDGVRALAMDCHQMLDEDKKYNKKTNATP